MSVTPILDLEQDPPALVRRHRWVSLIAGACLGAFIGISAQLDLHLPAFNTLAFFPILYVAIAFHEAGHLLSGKLAGMNPGAIVVAGFIFRKSGTRWIFRFDKRLLFGGGGAAQPLPRIGDFRVGPYAWMVAGGPLASLALMLAGLAGCYFYGMNSERWGTLFWSGVVTVAFSVVPFSVDSLKSDGARLLLLWRRPAEAHAWIALVMLLAEETNGVLPRDWTPELMSLALTSAPELAYVQLLAYCRSLDLGDQEPASIHLEAALANCAHGGRALRHAIFLNAASASVEHRRNVPQARTWITRASRLRKPETTASIEADIAQCEGRYADALNQIQEMRAFLDRRKLDSGLARFARQRLDRIERECRNALAAGA